MVGLYISLFKATSVMLELSILHRLHIIITNSVEQNDKIIMGECRPKLRLPKNSMHES